MTIIYQTLLIGFAVWATSASAQVSSKAPLIYYGVTEIIGRGVISLPDLSRNGPDNSKEIRKELLDANTIRLIAEANGLTKADLATVEIAPGFDTNGLAIYQIHRPDKAFKILSEQLGEYVSNRKEGHSKSFLLIALTNRLHVSTITDADLRTLMTNRPWLAVSLLKRTSSETVTNTAGRIISTAKQDEVMRWVYFTTVDANLGWRYTCLFDSGGGIFSFESERIDSKELDPKYTVIIKSVEAEVETEMKEKGQYGKLGSVHVFWDLKKEKLKAKGIDWHSPSELNPWTSYD